MDMGVNSLLESALQRASSACNVEISTLHHNPVKQHLKIDIVAKDETISTSKCEEVHRQIQLELALETDKRFHITVSSAENKLPLKVGSRIEVNLNSGCTIIGTLLHSDLAGMQLEIKPGKKKAILTKDIADFHQLPGRKI